MTHAECRERLVHDELGAQTQHHLDRCPQCRRFADANALVLRLAPSLVPSPSADLADRVLPAVRPRRPRMPLVPAIAAAAAAVLVVGGLTVLGEQPLTPEEVLLTAADRTTAEGTARVHVEAEAEVLVPAEADRTALEGVPAGLQAIIEAQWASLEAEIDALFDEIDALLGGAPRRPPPPPPAPPPPLRAGFTVRADGTVGFDRHLTLDGDVGGDVEPGSFRLTVRDGAAVYQQPDGTWVSLPGPAGPLGEILLDPTAIDRVLRSARGPVTVAGPDRYDFLALDGQVAASAWVDDEGRVRRLELRSDGDASDSVRWRTRMVLRLDGFGGAAALPELPATERVLPRPAPTDRLGYPFLTH